MSFAVYAAGDCVQCKAGYMIVAEAKEDLPGIAMQLSITCHTCKKEQQATFKRIVLHPIVYVCPYCKKQTYLTQDKDASFHVEYTPIEGSDQKALQSLAPHTCEINLKKRMIRSDG
jgi:hypothetical protein